VRFDYRLIRPHLGLVVKTTDKPDIEVCNVARPVAGRAAPCLELVRLGETGPSLKNKNISYMKYNDKFARMLRSDFHMTQRILAAVRFLYGLTRALQRVAPAEMTLGWANAWRCGRAAEEL
jgi:hypothetical protein